MTQSIPHRSTESRAQRWALWLALFLVMASPWHYRNDIHPANEAARVYAAQAIAEYGTPHLEPIFDHYSPAWRQSGTPPILDVAHHDGHYVLDKAPGITLLAVPIVAFVNLLHLNLSFAELTWLLSVLLSSLPTLYFALRLERTLGTIGHGTLIARAMILATPWLAYTGMLFSHALAAACMGLGAISSLGAFQQMENHTLEKHIPFRGGLLLGLAVLTEFTTAVLVVFVLAAVFFDRNRRSRLPMIILGGGMPLLALLIWNALNFGDPLALSYDFKAADIHATIHAQGFYGISWPSPERMWGILFGAQRGLFFLAPWLLLSMTGAMVAARTPSIPTAWRILLPLATLGFPLLVSGFVDWTAGLSMGPRHLIPALPLMAFAASVAMTHFPISSNSNRWPALLAGVVISSAVICLSAAYIFPYFDTITANPFYEVTIPVFLSAGSGATAWDWLLSREAALGLATILSMGLLAPPLLKAMDLGSLPTQIKISRALIVALGAAIHLGVGIQIHSVGPKADRQILEARAFTHEMLGQNRHAGEIRDALTPIAPLKKGAP